MNVKHNILRSIPFSTTDYLSRRKVEEGDKQEDTAADNEAKIDSKISSIDVLSPAHF